MITAVDTNVLLDLFMTNSPHHFQSLQWLKEAYDAGPVIVSDIVYAELVPAFPDQSSLDGTLHEINVALSPIDSSMAYSAGLQWKLYRSAGGPRIRIITDFLIGAHASATAEAFLTRDRGFFSKYFPELQRFQTL